MKKVLIGMLALLMAVGFTACTSGTPSMEELVASAKKDGASWTVDQWKDAFRDMAINVKPMMVETQEAMKLVETDPTKAMEMIENIQKKYGDVEKLMDEFNQAASATENGKKVADDEEFGKKLFEELGIPDLDM